MTVANAHCRITRGLDRNRKTFEFANIARSMHSRTLVVILASSRKRLYIPFAMYSLGFVRLIKLIKWKLCVL